MADFVAGQLDGFLNGKLAARRADDTTVAVLPAHRRIEGGGGDDHRAAFPVRQGLDYFVFGRQGRDRRFALKAVKTGKNRGQRRIKGLINGCVGTHVIGAFPGFAGFFLLLLHQGMKTIHIDGKAFFFHDLDGQVNGKTICIIELKGLGSGQLADSALRHAAFHLGQDIKPLVNSIVEFIFFLGEDIKDEILFFFQLRIAFLAAFNDRTAEGGQKNPGDAQQPAVTGGATDDAAQYITPAFIGGHDPVGYHKRGRTDMVGNDTDGHIQAVFLSVALAGNLTYFILKGLYGINVENRGYILNRRRQALQSHSGIYVLLLKLAVVAFAVTVKLGEDIVPYFYKAVAVTADGAVRLAAAVFFAAVIIDLRTRATRTRAVFPEIILLAKTVNPFRGDADLLVPDRKSLVIIQINRRVKTLGRQPGNLGKKLPGPGQ